MVLDWLADASTERLATELCELAAHLAVGECQWLTVLAEFDRREGWARWECRSCAHWLAWRCGLDLRAARERVRVARSLTQLRAVAEAFGRGELSYSKVRAVTRVATAATEAELVGLAREMTASQLERLVRCYAGVAVASNAAEVNRRHARRCVSWSWDDDGSLVLRARLAPEDGALVVQALEAAMDFSPEGCSAEHPSGDGDGLASDDPGRYPGAGHPPGWGQAAADALVTMAETLLATGPTTRAGVERTQVVVHAPAATLVGDDEGGPGQLQDGPALSRETLRRLGCDANVFTIVEDPDGSPLMVGRKSRTVPTALSRAIAARDGHCRFPGCHSRRWLDRHHIVHWIDGGPTNLANLCSLCRRHHRLHHEGGYTIEVTAGGLVFRRPDGGLIDPGPVTVDPADGRAVVRNQTAGTLIAGWDGTPVDYAACVDGLLALDDLLEAPIAS